jgi:SAM-dependent methyltransferase
VLDIGCGTGSLAFTFPEIANVASVTGIDLTEPCVEFARACNADLRISFQQADAPALPFEDNSFDRAFSMLVLQFIPDAARAVAEMCRVVRPGGTVTSAVWDAYGGMLHSRMLWDIAAVLDPSIERPLIRQLSKPNEMSALWRKFGFLDVEQTSLLIRMEFSCFDDYGSRSPGAKARVDSLSRVYPTLPVRRCKSMCSVPTSSAYLMGRVRSRAWHGPVVGPFQRNRSAPRKRRRRSTICCSECVVEPP